MSVRSLLTLLTLAVPGAVGQIGFYGPITTHSKAGDTAPNITFTNMLNAPGSASWSDSNLSGQLTVLAFLPNTSQNIEPVTLWNKLVEQFASSPVQFVWITGEKESTLLPWIAQHRVKGWVFYDPDGRTGRSYGLEQPTVILVGPDRKILGFYRSPLPDEDLVHAALEGRTTTVHPDKATIRAFLESRQVVLDAESPRMPHPEDRRPPFPPSYTLHVVPSQSESRANSSSNDYRSLQGFTLKEIITEVFNINSIRMDFPSSLDLNKRYDVALVLPESENREQMNRRFQQGLLDYFHLTASRETRSVEVYVVTAPHPKLPAVSPSPHSGMGSLGASSVFFEMEGTSDETFATLRPVSINTLQDIDMDGTVDEFCHTLEGVVDRPVINETNLRGKFQFQLQTPSGSKGGFLERLNDQLGIVILPSRRLVEILVFQPR